MLFDPVDVWDVDYCEEDLNCNSKEVSKSNPYHYHTEVEDIHIVHSSEEAYFVEYRRKRFWVPKSIIKGKVSRHGPLWIHSETFESIFEKARPFSRS